MGVCGNIQEISPQPCGNILFRNLLLRIVDACEEREMRMYPKSLSPLSRKIPHFNIVAINNLQSRLAKKD